MRKETGADQGLIPRIGKRLEAIARRIPPGSIIVDVGTDHGLLPVYLVTTGKAPKAIGIERSRESAALARRNARFFEAAVEVREGSGLGPLKPGEAQVFVLAGLGGQTITEILSERPEIVAASSMLVLQPMRDTPQVRRWLKDSGMQVLAEDLVKDGRHIYSVLTVRPGAFIPVSWDASEVSPEHELPPELQDNPLDLLLEYLRRRLRIRHSIVDKVEKSPRQVPDYHYAVLSSIRQAVQALTIPESSERGGKKDEH